MSNVAEKKSGRNRLIGKFWSWITSSDIHIGRFEWFYLVVTTELNSHYQMRIAVMIWITLLSSLDVAKLSIWCLTWVTKVFNYSSITWLVAKLLEPRQQSSNHLHLYQATPQHLLGDCIPNLTMEEDIANHCHFLPLQLLPSFLPCLSQWDTEMLWLCDSDLGTLISCAIWRYSETASPDFPGPEHYRAW